MNFPFHPSPAQSTGSNVQMVRGRWFAYACPAGWQVGEEGPFAVVLVAPDRCALTCVVGNSGLPVGYPPGQFIAEKLAGFGHPDLRVNSGPRPCRPMNGFEAAWAFDYAYSVNGVPCTGVAMCHVRNNYDSCIMAMTCAASTAAQWPAYANWLPEAAMQAVATSAETFGAAGVARQDHANAAAFGEQARQYRDWSQQTWNQVVHDRQQSDDRRHFEFRQAMGNVQRYDDPYTGQQVDLSATNAVYWCNPYTGQVVGSHDPSFDPRTACSADWQRMNPR